MCKRVSLLWKNIYILEENEVIHWKFLLKGPNNHLGCNISTLVRSYFFFLQRTHISSFLYQPSEVDKYFFPFLHARNLKLRKWLRDRTKFSKSDLFDFCFSTSPCWYCFSWSPESKLNEYSFFHLRCLIYLSARMVFCLLTPVWHFCC